jgi:hypothetical protein
LVEQPPDLHDLVDRGVDAAYEAWAETYDELQNLLIDAEGHSCDRSLMDSKAGWRSMLHAEPAGSRARSKSEGSR